MAKANPLFVDSTKLPGDSIGTQFELSRVLLYDEESLLVLITNQLGEVTSMPMTLNEEDVYQTRVWLRHQKSFTYQFVIEKGGQRVLQSVPKQARAQYAILERWEPVLAEPGAVVHLEPEPVDRAPEAASPTRIPEHARSVASLIEKFRF